MSHKQTAGTPAMVEQRTAAIEARLIAVAERAGELTAKDVHAIKQIIGEIRLQAREVAQRESDNAATLTRLHDELATMKRERETERATWRATEAAKAAARHLAYAQQAAQRALSDVADGIASRTGKPLSDTAAAILLACEDKLRQRIVPMPTNDELLKPRHERGAVAV